MGSGFILKLVDDYTFYGLSENFQIGVLMQIILSKKSDWDAQQATE